MLEEEAVERNNETTNYPLPCLFCIHRELCDLWEDGREVCLSFSAVN
ncbi:MAG TPA: hypothetical protein PLZ08_00270 [Bacillota bacterium]|jgi:hypothetical protein|nr:hypothetical protein [Bacillota bacterium]HOL08720.1 hypothetical protein [Bacillota bacterium]HPO96377.1 hypothetical protein [Bacillota bacterium]